MGGSLIVLSTFLQLLPKFYLSTALLVAGKADQEWNYRNAVARGLVVSLSAELVWTWVHPRCLPSSYAAVAVVASTLVTAASTLMAFDSDEFSVDTAFYLQCISGFLTIPVNQIGASWRLQQLESPARYRMVGWLVTVGLGTLTLVLPALSHPCIVVLLSSALPIWSAVQLQDGAAVKTTDSTQSELMVSSAPAICFLVFNVMVGTNAEAANDMAIGLKVRNELAQGHAKLAITNNLSILASQLLALVSETGFSQRDLALRSKVFCSMWCCCQLCRVFCLDFISGSSNWSAMLVAGLVFLDKYTGPLGQSALDIAGIHVLKNNIGERGWVPAAFLMSLRMASFKYERPMWDMLLLQEDWPITLSSLVSILTFLVFGFVFYTLHDIKSPKKEI